MSAGSWRHFTVCLPTSSFPFFQNFPFCPKETSLLSMPLQCSWSSAGWWQSTVHALSPQPSLHHHHHHSFLLFSQNKNLGPSHVKSFSDKNRWCMKTMTNREKLYMFRVSCKVLVMNVLLPCLDSLWKPPQWPLSLFFLPPALSTNNWLL